MMYRGFTLIEILLVVAIISVVAGSGFIVLTNIVDTDVLNTSAQMTVQAMRRAQDSAFYMRFDDDWGVVLSSVSATVFKGDDPDTRDSAYDEVFAYPDTVTVGGVSEVIFGKGTGVPVVTATVSITFRNGARQVVVGEAGAVSYAQ